MPSSALQSFCDIKQKKTPALGAAKLKISVDAHFNVRTMWLLQGRADQTDISVCYQPSNGTSTRHRGAAGASLHRRRGDRMSEAAGVRFWHKADIGTHSANVRFWG